MSQANTIDYQELAGDAAPGSAPPFLVRRFERETLAAPAAGLPHRHNFQEIILVESGRFVHSVDGQPSVLVPGTVCLIAQGQVHAVDRADDLVGFLLRFTDDFLPPAFLGPTWDYRFALFSPLGMGQSLLLPGDEIAEISQLLSLIATEHDRV